MYLPRLVSPPPHLKGQRFGWSRLGRWECEGSNVSPCGKIYTDSLSIDMRGLLILGGLSLVVAAPQTPYTNHKPQTPYTNPPAAKSCHMELTKDKAGNEECFDAEPDCKERCKPGVPVSWSTNQKKSHSKNPEANVDQELIQKLILRIQKLEAKVDFLYWQVCRPEKCEVERECKMVEKEKCSTEIFTKVVDK